MRLASSRVWEVRIDAGQSPRGDYLDTRQEDFRLAGRARFPVPEALYQLDCDAEAPILWLNSGHERLPGMLHSSANVGRGARIRDVVFDRIEASVWPRLFLRAARDVARLGEPAFAWQTAVLRRWLPLLYPEAVNYESRLHALRDQLTGGDEDLLLDRLDLLLQGELETARGFEILIEELEP